MNFRAIFPLVDFTDEFKFEHCKTNEDFLTEIVQIYFNSNDARVKEATLAVYMAYRDHYPSYLSVLSNEKTILLNDDIKKSTGKIIKLRRIALSALSKVA